MHSSYTPGVIGFLRFVGIANAAVWFGAAVFFTFGAGPAIFSPEVQKLFGEAWYRYYSGGVALAVLKRYFILQDVCGIIALLHLWAEWLYLGRKASRITLAVLVVLFTLGLLGGFWLQPKMRTLRQTIYFGATAEQKDEAARAFRHWHIISQTANLFIIIGLGVYLTRITRPPEAGRYTSLFTKFRS
jgi:hypothetical protein